MCQGCRLRGDVSVSRPDLDLLAPRRTSGTVQTALLDKTHHDAARLSKPHESAQHVGTTLAGGLRGQLRQRCAVSLGDVEHVDYTKPDPLRLFPSSVLVVEEHGREYGNAFLPPSNKASALDPRVEA